MKLSVKFFFAFFCLSVSAAEQPRPIGIEGTVVLSKVSPIDLKLVENKITVDYGKVYFSKVTINPNPENIGNTVTIKLRESSEPDPLPSTGPEKIGVRY